MAAMRCWQSSLCERCDFCAGSAGDGREALVPLPSGKNPIETDYDPAPVAAIP
jgi:hypothetical protein